jgi:hypothetical protein
MLFHLLGAVMLGVTAASIVMIVFRLMGRRAPRWALPLVAGAAMLGFEVWSEYTWYARTAAELPPGVVTAGTFASGSALKPWTLAVPRINRFSAVDLRTLRWNPEAPELRVAELFLVGRHVPTGTVLQVYDCDQPRRADMPAAPEFDASGRPTNVRWIAVQESDSARQLICSADLPVASGG